MRRAYTLSLCCLLGLFLFQTTVIQAQKRRIKGNGSIRSEERTISDFTELDIKGMFEVELKQTGSHALTLETDENLLDRVETYVKGNTLFVKWDDQYELKSWEKMKIVIEVDRLEKLDMNGMCSLKSASILNADKFELRHNGMGHTELTIEGEELFVELGGMVEMKLEGVVNEMDLVISGMAKVDTEECEAAQVSVETSGMGRAHVYAKEELFINSSGMGKVTYSGDARIKSVNSSGMSSINKN